MNTPRFTVTTEGRNDLDLRGLCESFVNRLWIPDHLSEDQAAEVPEPQKTESRG